MHGTVISIHLGAETLKRLDELGRFARGCSRSRLIDVIIAQFLAMDVAEQVDQ